MREIRVYIFLLFAFVVHFNVAAKNELTATLVNATCDSIYIELHNNSKKDVWLWTGFSEKFNHLKNGGLDQLTLIHQMKGYDYPSIRFVPIHPFLSPQSALTISHWRPVADTDRKGWQPFYSLTCIKPDECIIYPVSINSLISERYIFEFDNSDLGLRYNYANPPIVKFYPFKVSSTTVEIEFAYWVNPKSMIRIIKEEFRTEDFEGGFFSPYDDLPKFVEELNNYKVASVTVPIFDVYRQDK